MKTTGVLMKTNESSVAPEVESRTLTPYQRIIKASVQGKGIRLSADEVYSMALDTTIVDLAENDNMLICGHALGDGCDCEENQ